MKRILFSTLIVGCATNADIGISQDPIKCQPNAGGAANGTVTNPQTQKGYAFGAAQASLSLANPASPMAVALDDSSLALRMLFPCGQPQLGTYDFANGRGGGTGTACPFAASGSVSGNLQQVYANAYSGTLIVDQNVSCLAGRFDIDFGYATDVAGTFVDQGRVAGWFSIPVQ